MNLVGYSNSGTSGTLTVSDGTHTTQLNLIGTYTIASFKTADDGTGHTMLTDPPISTGQAVATTS